jgi:hypothetical protein
MGEWYFQHQVYHALGVLAVLSVLLGGSSVATRVENDHLVEAFFSLSWLRIMCFLVLSPVCYSLIVPSVRRCSVVRICAALSLNEYVLQSYNL